MAGKVSTMRRVSSREMTFEVAYEEFQMYNKVKNLSPHSIEYYFQNLKHIKRFMNEMGIDAVSHFECSDMNRFILWLQKQHTNAITINAYLRATRTFFYYCMREGHMARFQINLMKQERKIKATYSDEDIKKLIKKPDLKMCSFGEYRNWVMVQYFIDTGNRLNTVINMKVKDINLISGIATLTTVKNRLQSYSPLSNQLIKVLTEYIRVWGLEQDDYLFPNGQKQRISKDCLEKSIARYNKNRGVELTSIHAFRHTFAKNYIMTGGESLKLQRLLGHSTLHVTQTYVALFSTDLATDFDKHSILGRVNPEKIRRRA